MSSFVIRINGGAVMAGTLSTCVATLTNTGGSDVTIRSIAQAAPSSGVAFVDLAPGIESQTVPAGESITFPFSLRALPVQSPLQYDVSFTAYFSDGESVTSNTAQGYAIPASYFLTSPTGNGLQPQTGSLTFNSNTNSGLLGAV